MQILGHLSSLTKRFLNYDPDKDVSGRDAFGFVFFGVFTLTTLIFGSIEGYRTYIAGNKIGAVLTFIGLALCFFNIVLLKVGKISFFRARAFFNVAFIGFYSLIMFNGLVPSQSEIWWGFFVLIVTINSDPKYLTPISSLLIAIPLIATALALNEVTITPHSIDTLKQIVNVSIAGTFLGLPFNYLIHDAIDSALNSSRAKTDFLANISHEIRTPLNGMFGSLQVIKNSADEVRVVRQYTDVALQSYHSVLGLVNDILDLSKITEGKVSLYPEPVNLSDLIGVVMSEQNACAMQKGLKLHYECLDGRMEVNRLIDTTRVGQILRNLLSNAIKFTDKGFVRLTASTGKTSNEVIIVVEDSGHGIPPTLFDKIFEPFEQVDSSRLTERRGTGLGLAITKKLVHAMGGEITLESTLGLGTRFIIKLELPITHLETAEQTQSKSNESFKPARLLLADDVALNRKIFTQLLRDKPYEIVEATNGHEALVKGLTEEFDVIFMDVQMPVMDGLTAMEKLREANYKGPVVAFSANVMKTDIERYLRAGFQSVIGKPYVKDEVVNTVQTIMLKKPQQQSR